MSENVIFRSAPQSTRPPRQGFSAEKILPISIQCDFWAFYSLFFVLSIFFQFGFLKILCNESAESREFFLIKRQLTILLVHCNKNWHEISCRYGFYLSICRPKLSFLLMNFGPKNIFENVISSISHGGSDPNSAYPIKTPISFFRNNDFLRFEAVLRYFIQCLTCLNRFPGFQSLFKFDKNIFFGFLAKFYNFSAPSNPQSEN